VGVFIVCWLVFRVDCGVGTVQVLYMCRGVRGFVQCMKERDLLKTRHGDTLAEDFLKDNIGAPSC